MTIKNLFRTLLLVVGAMALAACTEQEGTEPDNARTQEPASAQTQEPASAQTQEPAPVRPRESAAECQLTMGWDPWEPYQYRDPKGIVSGLDVDLVTMAAERIGCDIGFHQADFADLLALTQEGEVDIVAGATRTEERESYARFSRPYRKETFALFVRQTEAGSLQGSSLEDLLEDGRRVGITAGFLYGDEVEALIAAEAYSDQFASASVGEVNLVRLIEGDIDVLLEDPFVASSIQRRLGFSEEVAHLDNDIHTGDVHLMFSRDSVEEETVARFDEALQELIDNGTRDRIFERYTTE